MPDYSEGVYISLNVKSRGNQFHNSPVDNAFLRTSPRFIPSDYYRNEPNVASPVPTGASPSYHAAYKELEKPLERRIKGWTTMDDGIKAGRGTGVGRFQSSFAPTTEVLPAPRAGLTALTGQYHDSDSRNQEVQKMLHKKDSPGPGQYQPDVPAPRKQFRRVHEQGWDGPFFLNEGEQSTRSKEILKDMIIGTDLGPGEYDGAEQKDALLKHTEAPKIGTGQRGGRSNVIKSLSVSRSIEHGIDWHIPVVFLQPGMALPSSATASGATALVMSAGEVTAVNMDGGLRSASAPAATGEHQAGSTGEGESKARAPPRTYQSDPRRPHSHNLPPSLGGAPPPPAHVARHVRGGTHKLPGSWDWTQLGHNWRGGWSLAHGGAYVQGDRTIHAAKAIVAAEEAAAAAEAAARAAAEEEAAKAGAVPGSNDPFALDALGGMFPILEEGAKAQEGGSETNSVDGRERVHAGLLENNASFAGSAAPSLTSLTSSLALAPSRQHTPPAAAVAPVPATEAELAAAAPAAPVLPPLATPRDIKRHEAAKRAARRVAIRNEKMSNWETKSAVRASA